MATTTIAVLHNQSLLDFAIQHTGNVLNAFDLSIANGISITDDLTVGMSLLIPETIVKDQEILDFYTAKNIKPATALTVDPEEEILEGIGYWYIYYDFKIS
ncbi:hypothetical protein ACFOWU_10030 [Epilithonimonas zeae]|uniref:LysM domain-containing protein n=1 Tax=Epilithonimonas zeae TaxID=1416779 RepID=A0A1N6GW01_9FLAO|nr:hypothetical protein [Epilithonimonas zeae]SIO11730.1 hypothetical protein SAMN05444409_2090 [Epilithonimonas zeae]